MTISRLIGTIFFTLLISLNFSTAFSSPPGVLDDHHDQPYPAQDGDEEEPADDADSEDDDDAEDEEDEDDKKNGKLTLESTRTIEFDTSEGTWMSLDVSPDGSTIIFELLGDLYTMPIEGGEATAIVTGMGFAHMPTYSPDGEKITYIDDSGGAWGVWIANADGTEPKQLSKDQTSGFMSPNWSVDGNYIYASRYTIGGGANQITMYHVKGGSGIDLTETGAPEAPRDQRLNATGAEPSPDGKYLYYATRFRNFSYNVTFPLWQIVRRSLETGTVDTIVTAQGSAMRPVVSPDGQFMVYATRYDQQTGLRIRNLESGVDNWLAYPVSRDEQESLASRDTMPNYTFTPDGSAVLITIDGGIKRIDVASGAITDIPFTARVIQDLGPLLNFDLVDEEGPIVARLIQDASQSPDGSKIVFTAMSAIYIMDLEDGDVRKLTRRSVNEATPTWSPDGNWITYVTWSPDGGGHIWRIRASGRGNPQRLTTVAALYAYPVISPDGATIVAFRASNRERIYTEFDFGVPSDVIKLPARGGDASVIMPGQGVGLPHFSSDPNRVYFYSPTGLMSVRLDGTDRKQHLQVTGPPSLFTAGNPIPANDLRISPDGNWALADVNNQIYLIAVPKIGGPAPMVNIGGGALPVKKLTDIGADYFGWSNDGGMITWSIGSTFYRQAMDTVSFDPPEPEEETEEDEEADGEATEEPEETADVEDTEEVSEETTDVEDTEEVAEDLEATPETTDEAAVEVDEDASEEGDEDATEEAAVEADDVATEEATEEATEDNDEEVLEDQELEKIIEALEDTNEDIEAFKVSIEFPRDNHGKDILLSGARVITMNGDEVIENGDVLVSGNKIVAVGEAGSLDVPAGAEVMDMSGKTIVPGYIDTHAHWFDIQRGIIDPAHWSFVATLAYGVTAGLDVQTATNDMFVYQDLIETGKMIGTRPYSTGPGIFPTNNFSSKDQVYNFMKRYRDHYRTRNLKAYLSGNRKQRQWVVESAFELGMMPTTEGGLDMKLDLTHIIDGFTGSEHAIPVFPLYKDVVELFAQGGTGYTPTLLVTYGGPWMENWWYERENVHDDMKLRRYLPHSIIDQKSLRRSGFSGWFAEEEYFSEEIAESATRILRAGGLIGVGSHGQLQGLGYHWELWTIAMGGMTEMEALRTATINGAKIIGRATELGSISEGKYADLVILNSNPLDNIRNTIDIALVMANGRLYDDDTMDQVWPLQKPLADFWWWDDEPK